MQTIRNKITNEILNSEYKQAEIARYLKVKPQTVNDYVKQKSLPALDTFAKLCRLLELDANYILGITDEYGKKNEEK